MSLRKAVVAVGLSISILLGGSSALANDEMFQHLEQQAVKYRELELLEPLEVSVISRAELREQMAKENEENFAPEIVGDWNQVLVFLGYIEEGENVGDFYNDLMGSQVLGYYDPETREMVVVSDNPDEWGAIDQSTFVHETTHALQDQHFGLRFIQTGDGRNTDDLYFARTSLIEGDATLTDTYFLIDNNLIQQALGELENMDTSTPPNTPIFLTESLSFPYTNGMEFVTYLWKDGGWERVNAAWKNPPNTSEQILHPEKYLAGEEAIPVAINDPLNTLGSDWRLLEYNENGEHGTFIYLLNSGVSRKNATSAAEGWGGDSTFIVTNGQETAMVWTSAWDTPEDAQEYYDNLIKADMERLGATQESIDANTTLLTADGWAIEIRIDGDVVTHLVAQSDETLELLRESQVNASVLEDIPGTQDVATPESTPVSRTQSVQFWVRED